MDLFSHQTTDSSVLDLFNSSSDSQDCTAQLHPCVWTPAEADDLFRTLKESVPWQQRDVIVFGKRYQQPRLVAWYGDPGATYTYSRLTLEPIPWIAPLLAIKTQVEALAGTTFNSVLANLYRDGQDTNGWHSDDEPELGVNPIIASVSLGTERRFDLRHKRTKETIRTHLPAGSVLIMAGRTQAEWQHQLPRTKKISSPRINLTFRRVELQAPQ